MTDHPQVSVIVPAYNAQAVLGDCLAAMRIQTLDRAQYEVIVVDDGSTDRTPEIARGYGVRLLSQAHAGPAAARNRGAEIATGELLLFTDADCAPEADWIEALTAPFLDADVAGAKGVYRTRQRQLVARFVQLEYEDRYARMSRQGDIDFVDTYSAAYRRNVFLVNGGFETAFPNACVEDQELAFRLARKGYRLVFEPGAVVYHRHNTTLGQYWRRKFNIGYWKALLLRWHPERAVGDSHTPQVLKLQIGLAGLLMLSLPLVVPWRPACWLAAAAASFFALSALPFLIHVVRRDPGVVLVAPLMLMCRALALGGGLAAGFIRFFGRSSPRRAPISGLHRILKRLLDVLGALAGLAVTIPVLAAAAVAIRLDSAGPILIVQECVGENGCPFGMVRLRTKADGAEAMLPAPVDADALESVTPRPHDNPRVTRVGRFLRRTRIDELPQLWNVLRGEMSLVGPRPDETPVAQRYSDWHRQRLAVKPGLTGPVRISRRGDLDLDARVQLELDYIEGYSLWKDLSILVRTMGAVLFGRGAC